MKVSNRKFMLVCFVVLLFGSAVALADWDPGDPFKMHYPQLPDPCGWDVHFNQGLAEDWMCSETGPVNDIHFWFSFRDDVEMAISSVTVRIYSDNPLGPFGFSEPNEPLWSRTFDAAQFAIRFYGTGDEGWLQYLSSQPPIIIPHNHQNYYQMNITNIQDPFIQQQGTIYWLYIFIDPAIQVGWKTSKDHFNDAAVWWDPISGGWWPMEDPCTPTDHLDLAFVITPGIQQADLDYGDAPEGGIAYPSTAVVGAFPTCMTIGPAGHIQHGLGWAHFVNPAGGLPAWDPEPDGDAGLCPPPGCFPTYDDDECFLDGDAGLMFPEPYTIDAISGKVVTCPSSAGTALGTVCTTATWGGNVDIWVVNTMPVVGYVNVLMDWKQDGFWAGVDNCGVAGAPEHVLVDFPVPVGYAGPLSVLGPPPFLIGSNPGYVWSRFTITNVPVATSDWNGEGTFEDGETEDYLLRVDDVSTEELDFGDAPDGPYPTLLASNGARHVISAVGPWLDDGTGTDAPDPEADGQPDGSATGDDLDGNDDEDGVTITPSPLIPGGNATISFTVAGIAGCVDGWIDWDQSGSFDAGEAIPGACYPLGPQVMVVPVPAAAVPGTTFARFRISSVGGLPPTGSFSDGEVEDHVVHIAKAPTPHLKWSQPPIEWDPNYDTPIYCGWDEPAFTTEPDLLWKIVADDFRCLGNMPVTSVHWWGSYLFWDGNEPPVDSAVPIAWRIGFWSNVPKDPTGFPDYSYPKVLLWEVEVSADRVGVDWVGFDQHPSFGSDSCFQYYVDLDATEWFRQGDFETRTTDNVFWLSIAAIYPSGVVVDYPWGWKTRPWHWMDDAVWFELHENPVPGLALDPSTITITPIEDPISQDSVDVAFELDTDPNYIKWEQPFIGIRRWPHYEDELSMAYGTAGALDIQAMAADDWPCDQNTPITAVTWWGSYIDYRYEACQDPVAVPPVKPDYFLLQIWTDVPDPDPGDPLTFSHPNDAVWQYRAYDYDEVLVGYDKYPEGQAGPREPVFRYSVRLPHDAWFLQDSNDGVYWLSVLAVYETSVPNYNWGWTNHEHVFNDDAVTGVYDPGGIPPWTWRELYDQTGESEDLSFILFTNPDCMAHSHPDYATWVAYGKPDCWCYARQCKGDIDDKSQLGGVVNVFTNDLDIFLPAFGTLSTSLPGVCADIDHGTQLGGVVNVFTNDLDIFLPNFGTLVTDCDSTNFNFWMYAP